MANATVEEIIGRIDRMMADYSASITADNSDFVEGVIYGLNLAIANIKSVEKGAYEHKD